MKIIMLKNFGIAVTAGILGLVVNVSQAAPLIPFSNGNVADANDVNTNFTELESRINTISLTPGATGPQGPAGTDGATGLQGPQGATGSQGSQGLAGTPGADGATGPQGLQGVPGNDGADGADGAAGAAGALGLTGASGATGPQGIPGTPGNDGADGATGAQGLTGATGPQGIQGVPGNDGVDGAMGAQGLTGATGPQGIQGVPGNDGADGATGAQGLTGATGPQGIPGIPGTDGADGATGPQGPAGPEASSADIAPISVDCATESLQAAIEAAPLHGGTVIIISGACSDDIYVRRNGITIKGFTGPGTDSITGTASGFSSDPADNFNLPAAAGALVQKNLEAAIEINGRVRVRLENLTIDAGSNVIAVKAERKSSLRLANVTLWGGADGSGLHASDSNVIISGTTITGDGAGSNTEPGAGAAVLAEMNSVIEIRNNNTFTGGDGPTAGFVTLSNTSVEMTGGSNIFNAGLPIGFDDEPSSLDINLNSIFVQLTSGSGNQINGDLNLFAGSRMFLSRVVINSPTVELVQSSYLNVDSGFLGDPVVFNTSHIFLDQGSTLELSEGGNEFGVTINSGGVAGTMILFDSIASNRGGSLINMHVQLFTGSSMDGGENAKIGGDLEVHGFSTYGATQQVGSSVLGTVTCFKGEAFDFTAFDPTTAIPLGSCL